MKVHIDWDESYPVYFESPEGDEFGADIELTDEELQRWRAAEGEYAWAQDLVHRRFEGSKRQRSSEGSGDDRS